MIGKTLAHYEIQEKIGQGGMGEVYRATDKKLGRDVALKVLPDLFAHDQERMARFQREAKVLASLNHPNVGAIYGLEEGQGVTALVLELIEGPTLEDRMSQGPIPLEEALTITGQIAQALEAAHEHGIIHRDLKPSNVKLTNEGQVKVLDFGLAKALEGGAERDSGSSLLLETPTITAHMTGPNVILGTAAYMSPEQARGRKVNKRSDVWAFGVLLYEMLTGVRLFDGETVSDTLAAVLRSDVDWEKLPKETPPRIRWLLRKALERNPRERLQDIGDARILIDDVRTGVEDDLFPAGTAAPLEKGKRSLFVAGLGVTTILALIIALIVAANSNQQAIPNLKFGIGMAHDDPSAGDAFAPWISPDGKHIAYMSEKTLWVRSFDEFKPRAIAEDVAPGYPVWSPDGKWLAYTDSKEIFRISPRGGEPTPIADLPSSNTGFSFVAGMAWTADSHIILAQGDGGLYRVLATGGVAELLVSPSETEDDFHNASAFPDNKGYLFVVHQKSGGYNRIGILTADGERKDPLTLEGQSIFRVVYSNSGHLVFDKRGSSPGIWALPFSLSKMEATGEPFIVASRGVSPSVSNTGTLSFVLGNLSANSQLTLFDREGKAIRSVGKPTNYWPYPELSPSGDRVVIRAGVGEGRDLWIVDLERETESRLTFTNEPEYEASWDPTGQYIFYHSNQPEGSTIYRIAANGTGEAERIGLGSVVFSHPNGRTIAFDRNDVEGGTSLDIWVRNLEEPEDSERPYLKTSADEEWAMFSPDGRYIAYVSNETGQDEVYLATFPDPRGKWQVSEGGGDWPRWRGDGKEIFYTTQEEIVAVSVETGGGVRLGRPQVLFKRLNSGASLPWPDGFDVTADGKTFILPVRYISEDSDELSPEIVVAQNWLDDLEAK